MSKVDCRNILSLVLAAEMTAFSVSAQMFAAEPSETGRPVAAVPQPSASQNNSGWNKFYQQPAAAAPVAAADKNKKEEDKVQKPATNTDVKKTPAKQEVVNPEDYIYKNVPQVDRPTLDGVKRGRTSVVPVVESRQVQAEGYIYLFYSDFSVDSMMNGATTCDVKFQIVTTLDRRLNSLAVRLKWADMETPLTFIDVNPNQQYHMTYTLLGDGCYSMDKIPNLIINRCRVKGMSQEECARKVRWIRKM